MERIEILNRRLEERYGKVEIRPKYRLVWSDDLFENRPGPWRDYTKEGIFLREVNEIRHVPKYTYIKSRWLLESLMEVPYSPQTEHMDKLSYECIWKFEDENKQPVYPFWAGIELIIEAVLSAAAQRVGKKYRDPFDVDPEYAPEVLKQQVVEMQERLFGNETDVTDALSYREGIVVPRNYEKH